MNLYNPKGSYKKKTIKTLKKLKKLKKDQFLIAI